MRRILIAACLMALAGGCALLPREASDPRPEQCRIESDVADTSTGCSALENYQDCYLLCGEPRDAR